MPVRVQTEDFDVGRELAALRGGDRSVGAVAAFVGTVRDVNADASVAGMTLEHYPGMTEKALAAIIDDAKSRWAIADALVIHRVGALAPADQIVLVGVTSAHRGDAFAACEFIIDYLKTRAPFWKKEDTPGGARWVEARASDDDAAARWRRHRGPRLSSTMLRSDAWTASLLCRCCRLTQSAWSATVAGRERFPPHRLDRDRLGNHVGTRLSPRRRGRAAGDAQRSARHQGGPRTGSFGAALDALLGDWRDDAAPRIACGMIGSRQGWIEAPYVDCPADLDRARRHADARRRAASWRSSRARAASTRRACPTSCAARRRNWPGRCAMTMPGCLRCFPERTANGRSSSAAFWSTSPRS